MPNAIIDALYAGSLRIKISYFFSEKCYIHKWCVTKVAHCISGMSTILSTKFIYYLSNISLCLDLFSCLLYSKAQTVLIFPFLILDIVIVTWFTFKHYIWAVIGCINWC